MDSGFYAPVLSMMDLIGTTILAYFVGWIFGFIIGKALSREKIRRYEELLAHVIRKKGGVQGV